MTAKEVVPRERANRDVDEAVAYYLTKAGEAVAMGFIYELQKAYGHIGRHPATGSPRYAHELNLPGLRAWQLARYPHIVFYVEQPDRIDVWRVLHGQRDIPVWMQEPENVHSVATASMAGLVKAPPRGVARRLEDFDPASTLARSRRNKDGRGQVSHFAEK